MSKNKHCGICQYWGREDDSVDDPDWICWNGKSPYHLIATSENKNCRHFTLAKYIKEYKKMDKVPAHLQTVEEVLRDEAQRLAVQNHLLRQTLKEILWICKTYVSTQELWERIIQLCKKGLGEE